MHAQIWQLSWPDIFETLQGNEKGEQMQKQIQIKDTA